MELVAASEVKPFANNKLQLYNLMLKNKYYLPIYSSKAVSLHYLGGVLEGRYYSLKTPTMKIIKLVETPSRQKFSAILKKN